MYFVLPALRIASRAGMDCSRGVSGWSLLSVLLINSSMRGRECRALTRIDAVKVVQVWREA
jgi:hypothetical protein